MALYILSDSKKSLNFSRHNQEVSYAASLNQKRIKTIILKSSENLSGLLNDDQSVLFILDTLTSHHEPILGFCNKHSIPVIAANNPPYFHTKYFFSTIMGDTSKCMMDLINYIKSNNKGRVSFFAVNILSVYDINNVQTLYRFYPNFSRNDVFLSENSVSESFDSFYENRYKYDTVFCVNDYAGIAFLKKMNERDPKYLRDRFVIGFMDTIIARLHKISLTSCSYSTDDLIKALASMYSIYAKHRSSFAAINITLYGHIYTRQSTCNLPITTDYELPPLALSDKTLDLSGKTNKVIDYTDDPEFKDLIAIDTMLTAMKKIDFNILLMLISGYSNSKICDSLFLTPQTLHYHISAMRKALNVNNTAEFIEKVSEYISEEKLKQYIETYIGS